MRLAVVRNTDELIAGLHNRANQKYMPKPKSRMAQPDKVDSLLKELEGEAALERALADASVYMQERVPELEKLVLGKKYNYKPGMLGEAEEQLMNLGRLQGDVPMPVIKKIRDGERRKHTEYSMNPVTGEEEVVAYMDPNKPTQVLQTVYGKAGITEGVGHQSEPAMLNALKLQGDKATFNDPEGIGHSDLQGVSADGTVRNVDVMFRDQSKPLAIPLYTNLQPTGRGGDNFNRALALVEEQVAKQGNSDYISAVESLVGQNKLGPKDPLMRIGKVLRGHPSVIGRNDPGFYHELIVPEYRQSVAKLRGDLSQQELPTAPDSIKSVDIGQALSALLSGKAGQSVKPVKNMGYSRKGPERLQLKPVFEETAEYGIRDATVDNPMLQQLLSLRAMQERMK